MFLFSKAAKEENIPKDFMTAIPKQKEDTTMKGVIQQIGVLDIALYNAIPSQTDDEDKRSLLAVQRSTAKSHGHYAYLEIGSHLA